MNGREEERGEKGSEPGRENEGDRYGMSDGARNIEIGDRGRER